MSESDEDRDHAPTQKKLDDARLRGEVARSPDLTAALAVLGLLLAALILGRWSFQSFGDAAQAYLDRAGAIAGSADDGTGYGLWGWVLAMLTPLLPFFVLPGLAAALGLIAQRAVIFSGEKLAPQLSRIDPFANAKHKFGREGLFEFAKSALKMAVTALLLAWFIHGRLTQMTQTVWMPAGPASAELLRLVRDFLILVTALLLILGGGDYLWQLFEHLRRNRMSHQELKEEFRESEGDPHIKSQRRRRAVEIASNRMLADVPKADVVIVNPTHYAVALKWDRKSGRAPVCVAKGVDEIAARIRETAQAAGVPIHSDPPTARALFATTELGREVGRQHFAPVAAAIRYAEQMRRKARERGRSQR